MKPKAKKRSLKQKKTKNNPNEKHFVTFFSPGTLFAESSTKEISSWDTKKACEMSKHITERYGAKPYGFMFETKIVGKLKSEWGNLNIEPKVLKTSGMYFIDGKVETLQDVKDRNDPREKILLSNMEINNIAKIVVSTKGYRWTQEFKKTDHVVDSKGNIVV